MIRKEKEPKPVRVAGPGAPVADVSQIAARVMAERAIRDGIGFWPKVDYSPHSPTPRQKDFLKLRRELEVFYGGAAGGGKSDALLMAALEYVHIPNYAAILFRRTYADLAMPGALMDRAAGWLSGKAHWNSQDKIWTFPSGATLSFGYLDTEAHKYRYMSAEFQFVGFDELTHFTETQYTYLFSRLRRLKDSNIPIRMRAGSNPPEDARGMWVKERFVPEHWDHEAPYSGPVQKECVDEETGEIRHRWFVPAKLDDNPHIDIASYEKSLAQLDPVTRAQLRRGDWRIMRSGDILDTWSEEHSVISWDQFALVTGQRQIPAHWQLAVFQDWGTTKEHPCVTIWFAAAAENAPPELRHAVFAYRELHLWKDTAADVKKKIWRIMDNAGEMERCRMWEMSHEAATARLEYLNPSPDFPQTLPFAAWETGKTRGIEQLRSAMQVRNLDKPHPFKPGLSGAPRLFFIVEPAQLLFPRDDAGFARSRSEIPLYRWNKPKSGETPTVLAPYALYNDAVDVLRGAAARFWPKEEALSRTERLREKVIEEAGFDPYTGDIHEGQQLGLRLALARASRALEKEWPEETPALTDISEGW